LCWLASAPTEHVRREDEPVARERSSRRTWTGEPGGVMMAEVGASRRGGVVLQRTAGNSDLAWEDHRAAVPLEVNASLPAQMQGLGLLGLKFCVHVFSLLYGKVGVGHH